MICKHCGELLSDTAKFCTACGAPQTAPKQEEVPVYEGHVVGSAKSVSFPEAVKLFFTRCTDFHGRSRRSEYWWVCLFGLIVGGIIGEFLPNLAWIWSLAIMVPTWALIVRRLHDVGKSGWFYLWILVPLVGPFIILIQLLKDSAADNQYGPNPKY